MVASGAMVTALEMCVVGVVSEEEEDGLEASSFDINIEGVGSGADDPPITHFSLIMHPSPILMGPSYEYSRARG